MSTNLDDDFMRGLPKTRPHDPMREVQEDIRMENRIQLIMWAFVLIASAVFLIASFWR